MGIRIGYAWPSVFIQTARKTIMKCVIPFWDPYCAIVGLALSPETCSINYRSIVVEIHEPPENAEVLGEFHINSDHQSFRTANHLPYVRVPNLERFALRITMRNEAGESVANEVLQFCDQRTDLGAYLRVPATQVWYYDVNKKPEVLLVEGLEDVNESVLSGARAVLRTRIADDGAFASATSELMKHSGTAREVSVFLNEAQETDAEERLRVREIVEVEVQLEAAVVPQQIENMLFLGVELGALMNSDELKLSELDLKNCVVNTDGKLHADFGVLPHLCYFFIASRDEIPLQYQGHRMQACAFRHFGRRFVLDRGMSQFLEDHLRQHRYFDRLAPLIDMDGVKVGPVGQLTVTDLHTCLSMGDEQSTNFVSVLRDSGIDPLHAPHAIQYANTIHALQQPQIFRAWRNLPSVQRIPPPQRLDDLMERVKLAEKPN